MSQSNNNAQRLKKLPSRVLYVLVGVIAVVFLLFWLVGFDMPYDEDPNFNAPLFTNVLLILMLLMTAGGIALVAWSVARSLRISGRGDDYSNNIPVKRIGYCVAGGTAFLLVLTFLLGSSAPMRINGSDFADAFWLRASDMFITTSLLLIAAAAIAVVYGSTKYIRRP